MVLARNLKEGAAHAQRQAACSAVLLPLLPCGLAHPIHSPPLALGKVFLHFRSFLARFPGVWGDAPSQSFILIFFLEEEKKERAPSSLSQAGLTLLNGNCRLPMSLRAPPVAERNVRTSV